MNVRSSQHIIEKRELKNSLPTPKQPKTSQHDSDKDRKMKDCLRKRKYREEMNINYGELMGILMIANPQLGGETATLESISMDIDHPTIVSAKNLLSHQRLVEQAIETIVCIYKEKEQWKRRAIMNDNKVDNERTDRGTKPTQNQIEISSPASKAYFQSNSSGNTDNILNVPQHQPTQSTHNHGILTTTPILQNQTITNQNNITLAFSHQPQQLQAMSNYRENINMDCQCLSALISQLFQTITTISNLLITNSAPVQLETLSAISNTVASNNSPPLTNSNIDLASVLQLATIIQNQLQND